MKSFSLIEGVIGFLIGFASYGVHDKFSNYDTQDSTKYEYSDTMFSKYENTLSELDCALDSANRFTDTKVIQNIEEKSKLNAINHALDNENNILAVAVNDAHSIFYDSVMVVDTLYIHKK